MKSSLALIPLLGIAACSGGGSSVSAQPQPTSYGVNGAQTQQRFQGATGLLAAIDGTTLQVQSTTEQTAVTYTTKTTFTDTVAATAAAVTVGSCVTVRDTSAAPTTASAAPTAVPTQATAVTAASVQVSAPVSGRCTGGLGQLRGPMGTPPPGTVRPTGPPNGAPGGARFAGGFGGAVGKVVSRSAHGFVVAATRPGETTTTDVSVTTTGTTTYTSESRATPAALKVGKCVTARGAADSSGTVAATSIALRPATNGACTAGFGRG